MPPKQKNWFQRGVAAVKRGTRDVGVYAAGELGAMEGSHMGRRWAPPGFGWAGEWVGGKIGGWSARRGAAAGFERLLGPDDQAEVEMDVRPAAEPIDQGYVAPAYRPAPPRRPEGYDGFERLRVAEGLPRSASAASAMASLVAESKNPFLGEKGDRLWSEIEQKRPPPSAAPPLEKFDPVVQLVTTNALRDADRKLPDEKNDDDYWNDNDDDANDVFHDTPEIPDGFVVPKSAVQSKFAAMTDETKSTLALAERSVKQLDGASVLQGRPLGASVSIVANEMASLQKHPVIEPSEVKAFLTQRKRVPPNPFPEQNPGSRRLLPASSVLPSASAALPSSPVMPPAAPPPPVGAPPAMNASAMAVPVNAPPAAAPLQQEAPMMPAEVAGSVASGAQNVAMASQMAAKTAGRGMMAGQVVATGLDIANRAAPGHEELATASNFAGNMTSFGTTGFMIGGPEGAAVGVALGACLSGVEYIMKAKETPEVWDAVQEQAKAQGNQERLRVVAGDSDQVLEATSSSAANNAIRNVDYAGGEAINKSGYENEVEMTRSLQARMANQAAFGLPSVQTYWQSLQNLSTQQQLSHIDASRNAVSQFMQKQAGLIENPHVVRLKPLQHIPVLNMYDPGEYQRVLDIVTPDSAGPRMRVPPYDSLRLAQPDHNLDQSRNLKAIMPGDVGRMYTMYQRDRAMNERVNWQARFERNAPVPLQMRTAQAPRSNHVNTEAYKRMEQQRYAQHAAPVEVPHPGGRYRPAELPDLNDRPQRQADLQTQAYNQASEVKALQTSLSRPPPGMSEEIVKTAGVFSATTSTTQESNQRKAETVQGQTLEQTAADHPAGVPVLTRVEQAATFPVPEILVNNKTVDKEYSILGKRRNARSSIHTRIMDNFANMYVPKSAFIPHPGASYALEGQSVLQVSRFLSQSTPVEWRRLLGGLGSHFPTVGSSEWRRVSNLLRGMPAPYMHLGSSDGFTAPLTVQNQLIS